MDDIRYNKSIVKNINESLIRKAIQGSGNFTKTKISKETGLSFPTVSRILDEMVASGEILVSDVDQTTGGRHAQSFVINPDYAYVLCLTMGKSSMNAVIVNILGEIVGRQKVDLAHEWNGEKIFLDMLDQLVTAVKETYPQVKAISMGLPWGVSAGGVILFGAAAKGLENFNIQEYIEKKYKISARVENDMNAVAAGCYERLFDRDRTRSLACINIGATGLGCGIYVRGHLVRGRHGFAGELRYLPADRSANLNQEYSDNFSDENKGTSIAQMVSAVCCTVDPGTFVFYSTSDLDLALAEAEKKLAMYLPEEVHPNLLLSNDYWQDFECGLIAFGREQLLQGYQIVTR